MPDINTDLGPVARRELNIFYILDTSGSMAGAPVATLNRAMEETVDAISDLSKKNADALLKIAVLEFNTGCKWLQPSGPEEFSDFVWEDLSAGGLTDMGAALSELDSKLSQKEFLKSMTGAYYPVIIFMTDGYAVDDFKKPLEAIRKNKWFKKATKIGFAIGEDPDLKMLSEVVGNSESVIRTNDLKLFARLLKFVSVTSSSLRSETSTDSETLTVKDMLENAGESDDVVKQITIDPPADYVPEPDTNVDNDDDDWDDSDW